MFKENHLPRKRSVCRCGGPCLLAVTFVKWPSGEDIPSVGKARAPGTQGLILLGARFGAFFALGAPRSPHSTAAGVHAELSRDRVDTFILIPLEEALLHSDVCTGNEAEAQG